MVVTNLADLLIAVLQPVVVFVLLPLACVRALGKFFLRRAGQGGSPPS